MTAVRDWSRVCTAFEVLGVDQKEEEVFWLVLAAITNLGVLTTKIGKYFNSLLYLTRPTVQLCQAPSIK